MFCCSKLLSTNKLPKNKCVVPLFNILNNFSTYLEMMQSQIFVVAGAWFVHFRWFRRFMLVQGNGKIAVLGAHQTGNF